MKRTLFVIALVGSAGIGHAQIQKGNVMVGGNLADWDLNLNKGGNFSINIIPKAGWFIQDNVAVGGYLQFNLSTAKDEGTSVGYGVGGFARYYFAPKGSTVSEPLVRRTRFFGEANVGIEGFNPAAGDNTNGLGLGVGPGIAYFITPNISLEGLLKYRNIVGFGSAASSSNLSFNLGFQVYLSKRSAKRLINEVK